MTDELRRAALARLARRTRERQAEVVPRAARGGPLPASFAQERMWFLEQLDAGATTNQLPIGLHLRGPLDAAALERALAELVRRHESLRTALVLSDDGVRQVVGPPRLALARADVSGAADPHARARELALADAGRPFDLAAGELLRALLVRVDEARHLLLFHVHHVAADAWSMGVLFGELSALYGAFRRSEPCPLPEPALQHADYAAWQRARPAAGMLAYWRERLAGAPQVLELPRGTGSGEAAGFVGRGPARVPLDVDGPALEAFGRAHGATLFMVLLAGFSLVLSRWTGQRDLLVSTPVANRGRPELAGVVGLLLNNLVLRCDLSGSPTVAELLERARRTTAGAFANAEVPFERVVEALQPERDLGRRPLVQAMLDLYDAPPDRLRLDGLEVAVESFRAVADFDLAMIAMRSAGGLSAALEYDRARCDPALVERMAAHLARVLRTLPGDPLRHAWRLAAPTGAEREELEVLGRGEESEAGECVHRWCERVAAERGDREAVRAGGRSLTYGELDRAGNRLARWLRRRGVGPEVRVGIEVGRGVELVVALLGVLKAGGVCVPLDPEYPAGRRAYMRESAGVAVVVEDAGVAAGESDEGLESGVGPENLCYVLYTSGSTGRPKGVGFRHGGLSNLIGWHLGELLAGARTLGYASMSFDACFHEVFSALCSGGSVVLASEEERRDVEALGRLVREQGVEKATLPPVVLEQLSEAGDWAGLRELTATGERLVVTPELRRLFASLPRARLLNQMGPTETHVVVGCGLGEDPEGWDALPALGRPIANTQVHVVDGELELAPRGVWGELCIAGAQLARGYAGEPGQTADRFRPDPYGAPGSRLYRSGDVCRWRPDGQLEYRGRADEQVKVRGQRVELGEVEAVLREHEGVREAVAGVRGEGVERRLVAWVVGDARPVELRGWLSERLPEAMVPQLWVELERLPLTASGKVDRRGLPEPEVAGRGEYEGPLTREEEVLAGIWAEVLGVERVGIHDDFFDLGGQSLLAARTVARVRAALGVELPVRALFEAPTIARLAGRLRGAPPRLPAIRPVPRAGPLPVSFAQRRLWFLDQLEPGLPVYNVAVAYRLRGDLDVGALAAALDSVVARHEVLRTGLPAAGGRPAQRVSPTLPLGLAREECPSEAEAWVLAGAEARRPFDLAAGPLLRARLLGMAADDHLLLLTAHHAVIDGWSQDVLERELTALYAGRGAELHDLAVQYADYAAWQQALPVDRDLEHWRRRLEGVSALELPGDLPGEPAGGAHAGGVHAFRLPAAAVRERARALGATPFMVLLAALAALVRRTTGEADIAIGTPVAGRQLLELEALIGCFVNTLVLRVDASGDPTFAELVERVRDTTLEADAHQRLPFERLVDELRPGRDLTRNPLFQLMLVLQPASEHRLRLNGLRVERHFVHTGTAKLDLTLSLQEAGDALSGVLEYRRDRFEPESAARLAARYAELLADAAARPHQRLSRLRLLPDAERRRLAAWSTGGPAGPPACLHDGFLAWAARTPDAPALRHAGRTLTYAELDDRARRVAGGLRRRGVRPGDRVGVRLEPSFALVAAVLGTLLAGAAYVPLDPEYPADRLAFMAADAGLVALLTDDHGDEPAPPLDAVPPVPPGAPCYVIYTSGSTGQPKGVVVTHAGAANAVADVIDRLGMEPGHRVAQVSSLSFDASVLELFGALGSGACLNVVARDAVRDPARLAALLRAEAVTTVIATPSLLVALDGREGDLPDLTAMTLGAEPCPPDVARRWSSGRRVCNLFAPTEASIYATAYHLPPGAAEAPAVGRPISGTRAWILDEHLQPLPAGAAGEVCVGGAGVALGYLGQPGLTAARFVPDPTGAGGERLYRTGDLGRWRADGQLEFLGRQDQQVKVRGHRVELGEVEAALRAHPAVREAAAVLLRDRPGGRLVAYWVPAPGAKAGPPELRTHLRAALPEPMVPAAFFALDALPLTATGKPDRVALSRLPVAPASPAGAALEPPVTDVEAALAGLWAAVLGVPRVGRHDDFFELGGESLLAAQLVARSRTELGLEVTLRDLFEEPTVAGMARRARPAAADGPVAASSERRRRAERLLARAGELDDDDLEAALRELEA